jgi:hypothetical protein
VALLLELSDAALAEGMLDEFWAVSRVSYPEVMGLFERLLPTYPRHVARRTEEMAELELTVSAASRTPVMATAVRTLFQRTSRSPAYLEGLVDRLTARDPGGSNQRSIAEWRSLATLIDRAVVATPPPTRRLPS